MNARADWRTAVAALTPGFAARAAELNDTDDFVADNYRELKESGLLAAGVPQELGGLGLEVEALCEMLRTIAHACPSTALALSMHTHQVAVNAWRWRHQSAPVAPLLEKVARENIIILSTAAGTGSTARETRCRWKAASASMRASRSRAARLPAISSRPRPSCATQPRAPR